MCYMKLSGYGIFVILTFENNLENVIMPKKGRSKISKLERKGWQQRKRKYGGQFQDTSCEGERNDIRVGSKRSSSEYEKSQRYNDGGSREHDDSDVIFVRSESSTCTFYFFVVDSCWREKTFRKLLSIVVHL